MGKNRGETTVSVNTQNTRGIRDVHRYESKDGDDGMRLLAYPPFNVLSPILVENGRVRNRLNSVARFPLRFQQHTTRFGSAIFSQWRYFNHGPYEHAQEKDKQCFLLMLRLLRELA